MRQEHGHRAEALVAQQTHVGLVRPRYVRAVSGHVLGQTVRLSGHVGALVAPVHPVPQMYLQVRVQDRFLLEGLVAMSTFERSFIAVRPRVVSQMAALHERLAAVHAQERFFPRVPPHVQPELCGPAEAFATQVAHFRSSGVQTHVGVQDARLAETLKRKHSILSEEV